MDIEIAIGALREGASVALARDGVLLGTATGHGVIPLLTVLRSLGGAAPGASVADKVVGRSVAMIMFDAGVSCVHATLTSEAAASYLKEHQIPFTYDELVPFITDMTGKNLCPIERMGVGREDAQAVRRDIEARFMPKEER